MADVNATAGAEQLAQDRGVDLSRVNGTGSGGKVTKEDVQAYLDSGTPSPEADDGGLQDQPAEAEELPADTGGQEVYRVKLNPRRSVNSGTAVVLYLDGERREFKGGEYVTADEFERLAAVKDAGGKQYLVKEGGAI